jgi:hypothetical protein
MRDAAATVGKDATAEGLWALPGQRPRRSRPAAAADEVAAEIVESLQTALDRFRNVAKALGEGRSERGRCSSHLSFLATALE